MILELLRALAGIADAHQQHPGRKGVQGSRVAHLQVLFREMPESGVLELADDVGRGPAIRLVHREDDALRVTGYITGKDDAGNGDQKAHQQQGILSMRFW